LRLVNPLIDITNFKPPGIVAAADHTTMGTRPGVWRPLSIPEIIKRAEEFEYNPLISLKYWLRTADALQKEACSSYLKVLQS
jgi:hypothetical protein